MSTVIEGAIAILLLTWLIASAIGQFGVRSRWVRMGSLGWSLPEWRLFAPSPALDDYFLVYRTRTATGDTAALAYVDARRPSPCRGVWNPAARRQKMLRDLVGQLLRESDQRPGPLAGGFSHEAYSTAYLLLLGAATSAAAGRPAKELQFAVFRASGGDQLEPVLVSAWHPISNIGLDSTHGVRHGGSVLW